MDKEEFLKEVFENYFQKSLGELLPTILAESIRKSVVRQEFISLNEAIKKYNLSLQAHLRGQLHENA